MVWGRFGGDLEEVWGRFGTLGTEQPLGKASRTLHSLSIPCWLGAGVGMWHWGHRSLVDRTVPVWEGCGIPGKTQKVCLFPYQLQESPPWISLSIAQIFCPVWAGLDPAVPFLGSGSVHLGWSWAPLCSLLLAAGLWNLKKLLGLSLSFVCWNKRAGRQRGRSSRFCP